MNVHRLKWLILIRLLFALLLMGSTILYQMGNQIYAVTPPIFFLYTVSFTLVLLSLVYGVLLSVAQRFQLLYLYGQIILDTFFATLFVLVTGGYASVFPFLFLVVIIYSSVFVYKRGSLWMAFLCSLQFILLLILEKYGAFSSYAFVGTLGGSSITTMQILQKGSTLSVACFSVAFLSGHLADQERKSKSELVAMEAHLNRVQNLAQIGEMAAGLAHEIKNPLASISGAVQILNGEIEKDSDEGRLMHIVLRETNRLSSLVNNFLSFARPTVGQVSCVDLAKSLTEIVTLFVKDEAVRQRIDIALDVNSSAFIEIDPWQLHQVIWNLLVNSVESIENRGKIMISVKKGKGDRVRVEVADNGCGMDEKTMATIFNPFFTTKAKGSGLGLSIVYRILETYDARLDVKSKPGTGSTFTIYFKTSDPTF